MFCHILTAAPSVGTDLLEASAFWAGTMQCLRIISTFRKDLNKRKSNKLQLLCCEGQRTEQCRSFQPDHSEHNVHVRMELLGMAVQTLRLQHVFKKTVQIYGSRSEGQKGKEGESRGIWLHSFLIHVKLFEDTTLNPDPQSSDQHLF